MVTMPNIWRDPTLIALDNLEIEKNKNQKQRDYLGASSIGDECSRKLWYRFQGYKENFDVDTLRRFNDGHRTEDLIVSWFRELPFIELYTHKEDGVQFGFSDFNGKYKGHYDGVIRGLVQAPKAWHIFEVKCTNEKNFDALQKLLDTKDEKEVLQEWSPEYYAQAVTYMDYEGLDRHYLVCATAGARRLTSIRTNANPEYAASLRTKAGRIIKATTPPERIGGRDYYKCKWCAFRDMCHEIT